MVYDNILEAIGNTPVIRLNRMPEEGSAQVQIGRASCRERV